MQETGNVAKKIPSLMDDFPENIYHFINDY